MSAPEPKLRLTRAAERELEDIAMYTEQSWDGAQHASYRAAIDRAFTMLRAHPRLGQSRDDLYVGCRNLRVEHHVINYDQPDDATIVVRRILHQRQDAFAAVTDPRS
jgi:toxin ParE1/3/4